MRTMRASAAGRSMRRRLVIPLAVVWAIAAVPSDLPPEGIDFRLWYRQPAASWHEALPIGNRRLGAMTAGIAEMLLQSHAGEIALLPALPSAWPGGRVTGLQARGAVGVDITWRTARRCAPCCVPAWTLS